MHELAVCQALLQQVEQIAAQRAAQVLSITLHVGPLAGVEPALLEHAFPVASAGTRAAGARLIFEMQPIRVRCGQCERESEVPANRLLCAHCGDWRTELTSGAELVLASLELTTNDVPHAAATSDVDGIEATTR